MNFCKLFLMMSLSLFCANDLWSAAAAAAAPLRSAVSSCGTHPAMPISGSKSLMASVMQKIAMKGGFADMPLVQQNLCFNSAYNFFDYVPPIGLTTPKLVFDHDGRVICSMELNKTGNELLTLCTQCIVRRWNMIDGTLISRFDGLAMGITGVKFNKTEDGLLARYNNGIVLLNLDGTIRTEFNHDGVAYTFEFNKAGDKLLSAGSVDGFVRIWNLDGTEHARFDHGGRAAYSAQFNSDESLLVTSCEDSVVRLWDVNNPHREPIRFDHKGTRVTSAQFIKNETALLTKSDQGIVRVWDIKGSLLDRFDHDRNYVASVQLNKAGDMLLTSCYDAVSRRGGQVRLWNIATKEFDRFDHDGDAVFSAIFNGTEDLILSTGRNSVKVWTIDGLESGCLNLTADPLAHFKQLFNRSEDGLFTVHCNGTIKLWDISFLKQLKSLNQEHIAILLALDQAQRNNPGKSLKLEDIIAFYALDESQLRKTVQSFHPTILKHIREFYGILDMDRYLVSEEEWIKFVIAGFAPDFLRDM